ncbi:TBP family protein [Thermococcus chitonophagus]|uniref:hypothetical protein n=1 Tax=Thermococcus chitonophagus TaxID=54262 RepID=UPI00155FF4F7|nr:hypothetical protein [Thermococcus chitonophagus]
MEYLLTNKTKNLVISGKLGEKLSLEELAIKLPNVECVVVGAKSFEEAENTIKKLKELLKS